ncbi:MAG: hypothetical protein OXH86_19325 [Acidimicrobiaceae bacterium]|nr:hypothetical protein [Acidimicrobiaceae bacterium]
MTSAVPTQAAETPPASEAAQEASVPVSSEGAPTLEADESHDESLMDTEAARQKQDSEPSPDHEGAIAKTEAAPEVDTDAEPSRDERCEPAIPPPWAPPEFADTWMGTAIIVPRKLVDPWAGDTPAAPAAGSQFEGAELVFHGACEVQLFDRDGTATREWAFAQPIRSVYPDGAGGIVYYQYLDSESTSVLRWWPAEADEPMTLLDGAAAFDDGGFVDFFGVTVVDGSPVVLYTTVEWPEDDDGCAGCNPNYREVLYRRGLSNADSLRLGDVGGYEWGFGPRAITPDAVYGFNGSDGGQWNSAHALDPSTTADLPPLRGPDGAYSECFEEPDWEWCPTMIAPVDDDFVAGFWASSDVAGISLFVLAYIDGGSGEFADFFPVMLTDDGWSVLGVHVWGSHLVLNTSNRRGLARGRWVEHLRRPIIVDLALRTAEVYDRYGTFHLTPIWDR